MVVLAFIIGFITLFIPGFFLALALFRNKTKLNMIDISVIGFIFGIVFVPTLTWLESYLMFQVHAFSFSLGLFEVNALVLTILGLILSIWQHAITKDDFAFLKSTKVNNELYALNLPEIRSRINGYGVDDDLVKKHEEEESSLEANYKVDVESAKTDSERENLKKQHDIKLKELELTHKEAEINLLSKLNSKSDGPKVSKPNKSISSKLRSNWAYTFVIILVLISFYVGMMSEVIAPVFYQFDPYYYMISESALLTYGYQPLYTHYAWPALTQGTITRTQPVPPYLEGYFYDLANFLGPHYKVLNTSLMSYTASLYPPIIGALLVYIMFMLLYNEYGKEVAIIGAILTATMPLIVTEFTAGQQLTEPWGIFSLFFFFMAYLMAVKDKGNMRYSIFAGLAFVTGFLGAHYYIVTTGVLMVYILIEGLIDLLFRNGVSKDFYKMNIIVIAIIGLFLAAYVPYHATFSTSIPRILGVPLTFSGPVLVLLLIAVMDYGPKILKSRNILFKSNALTHKVYAEWIVIVIVLLLIALFLTPLSKSVGRITFLVDKFVSLVPSNALFMTVAEYEPLGLTYNFGSAGFGFIGESLLGLPIIVWIVCVLSIALILISIIYRKSERGVFYLAIALPLMFAGFSRADYLVDWGLTYVMLICIILGELLFIILSNFKLKDLSKHIDISAAFSGITSGDKSKVYVYSLTALVLFFISPLLAIVVLLAILFKYKVKSKMFYALLGIFLIVLIVSSVSNGLDFTNYVSETSSVALSSASSVTYTIMGFASNIFSMGEISSITNAFYSQANYALKNTNAACGTSIGYDFYCNVVPSYWLSLGNWLTANVGPTGPRVLAWWDYGDWINFFGHSYAFLRGDNADPAEDEATAAQYVLGPSYGFNSSNLVNMMNTNQTKYVVFDKGIISKWGALDFLGCVYVNATSRAFAVKAGQEASPSAPYELGTSKCEIEHDPQYVFIPLEALDPSSSTSLSYYCSISNATDSYIQVYTITNGTYGSECMSYPKLNSQTDAYEGRLYDENGTSTNGYIAIYPDLDQPVDIGETAANITGTPNDYLEAISIYTPNANGIVANAPTDFYTSNFYNGFFLGNVNGMHQVYSYVNNTTGVNYLNYTDPIRLMALNNFTGKLPPVNTKPPFVHNNYSMP